MGEVGSPGFKACLSILIIWLASFLFWITISSNTFILITVLLSIFIIPVITWIIGHLFAVRATPMMTYVAKGKVKSRKEVWFVAEKQPFDWTVKKLLTMAIYPVALIFGVSGMIIGITGEVYYPLTASFGLFLIFPIFSVFIILPKWILKEVNIRRVNRNDKTIRCLAQPSFIEDFVGLSALFSFLNYIKLDWSSPFPFWLVIVYLLLIVYPMGLLLTLLYTRFSFEKNVDKLIQEFEEEGFLLQAQPKVPSVKPIGVLVTEQLLAQRNETIELWKRTNCPSCGTKVYEEDAFCPMCGASLAGPTRFCSNCGAKAPKEALFCPACGRRLLPR